jgi:nickel/cobalt transporter (NicO) family protein
MHTSLIILLYSALAIGVVHTLMGPDHYLPFIVMSKARNWSILKTTIITIICGIGHVLSAVVLGLIAVSIGITLTKLNFIESWRGEIAAWLLIGFGLIYFIWGVKNAIKNKHHHHFPHEMKSLKELTPWILFTIFILGPCEPLIPLIMYPAIKGWMLGVWLVTLVFGLATLVIMLFMVLISVFGINYLKGHFFVRYGNAMAGAVICCSGLAIKFLGL